MYAGLGRTWLYWLNSPASYTLQLSHKRTSAVSLSTEKPHPVIVLPVAQVKLLYSVSTLETYNME